ncbi:SDR family NAD(P)-dependent oxidoreductase [Chloroflexota bacterium]
MGKLDGRVAIITGGGTGIGRGIALEFANQGADVAVAGRNIDNIRKVAEEVAVLGRRSLSIPTDVRVKEQVQNMVKRTIDGLGRIDILVNNAGTVRSELLLDVTEEAWYIQLDTNLKSVFLCTQAVAKYMTEQKYGKIINLSSTNGHGWNLPGLSSYSASKAGVIELTRCYAKELGPYNINVNAIAPGVVITDMFYTGKTPEEVEERLNYHRKASVLGRAGTTEDIAHLALFLASDDSSFISGQFVPINGGRTDFM